MPQAPSPTGAASAGASCAPMRHVFVYGTLRAGGRNDIRRFTPPARFVGAAELAGTLYDLGAYPGATLGGTGRVLGEVWRIGAEVEAQLDALEEVRIDDSGEYRKREVTLEVGGMALRCLVYEVHPARIAGRRVIASGDWLSRGG